MRQLLFFVFFLRNKHTHTHTHTHKGEGKGFQHKSIPQLHSKVIVTFKGGWDKLYYTQHTLLSNVRQLLFIFSFFFFLIFLETNTHTHTHTQRRGKEVLTQKYTTIPLKSHVNF